MSGVAGAVRAFVALEIPAAVRERLADVAFELADRLPALRAIPDDNVHLTLRFLGATTPAAIDRVKDGLAPLAARCAPATARVTGLGTFPPRGRVRVLWAGLDLPPALAGLQRDCEALARTLGFAPEERDFTPHLTLGRWREPSLRPELPPLEVMECALEQLVLFRSELSPQGSRYTPLAAWTLGAAS